MSRPSISASSSPIVLRWPAERRLVEALAGRRVPRLLLVEGDAEPPVSGDPLEDWVRLPVEDRDIEARMAGLRLRAEASPPAPQEPPVLDGHGRMLRGSRWVKLSPVEEQLAMVLVDNLGDVVSDTVLFEHGWPGSEATPTALRIGLMRLRRRIGPLGLEIRTIRGRGYLLELT